MRALIVLAVVGCMEDSNPPLIPKSCSTLQYFEGPHVERLDILFVIDDSQAMVPYLDALNSNAPVFMNILQSLPSASDLRIAVAHASSGALVDPVPCGVQAGLWIEDANQGRIRNYSGTLQDVFGCMVHVGTDVTNPLQTLASAQATLLSHPEFLRDNAALFVVIISPQDDASNGEAIIYRDALNTFKSSPNHVAAAAITRPLLPRLKAFIDSFGPIGTLTSIDQTSWADAFSILYPIEPPLFRFCVDAVLLQPARCTFSRVQHIGTPMQRQIGTMPPCDPNGQSSGVCAALIPGPNCYISQTQVALCYNGFDPSNPQQPCPYGNSDPVDDETVVIECAIECN